MDNLHDLKDKITRLIKSPVFLKAFAGLVLGLAGGYLYYHFIGCSSGSCPMTKNPYISTAFGGLLGFTLLFNPGNKKDPEK